MVLPVTSADGQSVTPSPGSLWSQEDIYKAVLEYFGKDSGVKKITENSIPCCLNKVLVNYTTEFDS